MLPEHAGRACDRNDKLRVLFLAERYEGEVRRQLYEGFNRGGQMSKNTQRDSFVLTRNVYNAICELNEKDGFSMFEAICEFMLNGKIPDYPLERAFILLAQPYLNLEEEEVEDE